jgi:hypothetical protein
MKKLFVLVAVLAMVAALVVPLAASAETVVVSGTIPPMSLSIVTPSAISFGQFTLGENVAGSTNGEVHFNPGIDTGASWYLNATATYGNMYGDNYVYLTDPMYIKMILPSIQDTGWGVCPGGVSLNPETATSTYLNLYADQTIVKADVELSSAATYTNTITLSYGINY